MILIMFNIEGEIWMSETNPDDFMKFDWNSENGTNEVLVSY